MSIGQMIAQSLIGAPPVDATSMIAPVTAASGNSRDAHVFAGVLRGVSSHAATKSVSRSVGSTASQAVDSNATGAEAAETQYVMASVQAGHDAGKNADSASSTTDKASSEQQEQSGQLKVGIPQNVVLSEALVQLAGSQQIEIGTLKSTIISASEDNTKGTQFAGTGVGGNILPELGDLNPMDSPNLTALTIQQNAGMDALLQQETPSSSAVSTASVTANTETPGAGKESGNNTLLDVSVISVNKVPTSVNRGDAVITSPMNTSSDSLAGQSGTSATRGAVQPTLDTYFQTSVAPQSNIVTDDTQVTQTTTPLTIGDASTLNANATLAGRVHVAARTTDSQPVREENSSRQESVENMQNLESSKKNIVAQNKEMLSSEGESSNQDGNGVTDHRMGAQDQVALKLGGTATSTGTFSATASDQVHTDVMQQVVNKISDHLAGRETKSGVEQITIRLSPENLGELKLNLRMENQCLKVEIVAEHSTVRDALIKHSDTLKETLARQNISMEAFDVSTGSNGKGSTSYGNGDWRELARQQQQKMTWNFSGGYRTDDSLENSQGPIYRAPVEHSMVDVHF